MLTEGVRLRPDLQISTVTIQEIGGTKKTVAAGMGSDDLARMSQLVSQYADLPLGVQMRVSSLLLNVLA